LLCAKPMDYSFRAQRKPRWKLRIEGGRAKRQQGSTWIERMHRLGAHINNRLVSPWADQTYLVRF